MWSEKWFQLMAARCEACRRLGEPCDEHEDDIPGKHDLCPVCRELANRSELPPEMKAAEQYCDEHEEADLIDLWYEDDFLRGVGC